MPDILAQSNALVMKPSGVTISADVFYGGDTIESFYFIRQGMNIFKVCPSNFAGVDWKIVSIN